MEVLSSLNVFSHFFPLYFKVLYFHLFQARAKEKERELQRAFAEKERQLQETQLSVARKLGEAEQRIVALQSCKFFSSSSVFAHLYQFNLIQAYAILQQMC